MGTLKAHFGLQQPARVLVIVRGNSGYRKEPPREIIEHVLSMFNIPKTKFLFLASEDWGRTIHVVFDLYHTSYDFDTAHIAHKMHVVMVSLGGKQERKWFASSSDAEMVNKRIAELHNFNGWVTRPPFFANHASGAVPIYDSPRDMEVSNS
jgi:hypothetical protein